MVFTQDKICQHLGFGQAKHHAVARPKTQKAKLVSDSDAYKNDYFVNDSLYRWDKQSFDWITTNEIQTPSAKGLELDNTAEEPVRIDWELLTNIHYRLRYFNKINMEMYAPVFSESLKKIDGKEVIIEGFVFPLDEEEGTLSLSRNPYASCFFCGKASPASVMSIYLKKDNNRYKIDDFRKFRGTLHLNQNDTDEFYYILKDVHQE